MVVLTFQLLLDCETVSFFSLGFFLLFFCSPVSILFFRRIFRFSPQSHSLSHPFVCCNTELQKTG